MEKIIDIEERVPVLNARRRRRTNRRFALLLAFFLAILLAVLYWQSPYSKIGSISISGGALVPAGTYRELLPVREGDSLFRFRTGDIERALAERSWVKSATVERLWPNRLAISITEHRPVAAVEAKDGLQTLLADGSVFPGQSRALAQQGPILQGFKSLRLRAKIVKELAEVDESTLLLISQIALQDEEAETLRVYMSDGYEVRAVIPSFAEKINYYPSIVGQLTPGIRGVIDLEVGSYFEPYSGEAPAVSTGEKGSTADGTR